MIPVTTDLHIYFLKITNKKSGELFVLLGPCANPQICEQQWRGMNIAAAPELESMVVKLMLFGEVVKML